MPRRTSSWPCILTKIKSLHEVTLLHLFAQNCCRHRDPGMTGTHLQLKPLIAQHCRSRPGPCGVRHVHQWSIPTGHSPGRCRPLQALQRPTCGSYSFLLSTFVAEVVAVLRQGVLSNAPAFSAQQLSIPYASICNMANSSICDSQWWWACTGLSVSINNGSQT